MEARTCDGCGETILQSTRADQRYHNAACRMRAKRERDAKAAPQPRQQPLAPQLTAAMLDLDRVVRRIERLAADDRYPKCRQERHVNTMMRAIEALRRSSS